MGQYRLYFLKDSRLIGESSIEAGGHDEAARLARQFGQGEVVEVWSGPARVRIVAPAKRARRTGVTEN
jgi:hypothetical protein